MAQNITDFFGGYRRSKHAYSHCMSKSMGASFPPWANSGRYETFVEDPV